MKNSKDLKNSKKSLKLITLFTFIFVLIDQLSKFLANFLSLEKSLNPGIAFGIRFNQWLILLATIVLIFLIIKIALESLNIERPLTRLTLSLILGGAIGNMIDRVLYGQVTDFISSALWPTFNLADVFIVVGVVLGLIFYKRILK